MKYNNSKRLKNKLYEVEKIITRKIENSNKLYLIKWKGYSLRYCSWEPIPHLENILDMVNDFENNFPFTIDQKALKTFFNLYNKALEKKNVFKEKTFLKRKTKKNSLINNKITIYLDLDDYENIENNKINEKQDKGDNMGNEFNFVNLNQKKEEIEKEKVYENNEYNFMDLYVNEKTKDIDTENHISIILNEKNNEETIDKKLANNDINENKLGNNFMNRENIGKLIKPILIW